MKNNNAMRYNLMLTLPILDMPELTQCNTGITFLQERNIIKTKRNVMI